MGRTCFVIMPIGSQKFGNIEVSAEDLRCKYDDLIKEAISNARADLEIIRSDDVAMPGTITTDILLRLMHADYVVADVTYPNPNVFYELGIRHACRSKTILIKEKIATEVPFDISHLRHIEYENSVTGLKKLSVALKTYFDFFDANLNALDNHFLETAKATGYKFLKFDNEEDNTKRNVIIKIFQSMIENPALRNSLFKNVDPNTAAVLKALSKSPETSELFLGQMIDNGTLKI
jgi:hypothetical protein